MYAFPFIFIRLIAKHNPVQYCTRMIINIISFRVSLMIPHISHRDHDNGKSVLGRNILRVETKILCMDPNGGKMVHVITLSVAD